MDIETYEFEDHHWGVAAVLDNGERYRSAYLFDTEEQAIMAMFAMLKQIGVQVVLQ